MKKSNLAARQGCGNAQLSQPRIPPRNQLLEVFPVGDWLGRRILAEPISAILNPLFVLAPAEAVEPIDFVDRLRTIVVDRFRPARPDLNAVDLELCVFAGLQTVRNAHQDFDALAMDLVALEPLMRFDCAVTRPEEYFEALYVIFKHASFFAAARERLARQQQENTISTMRVN